MPLSRTFTLIVTILGAAAAAFARCGDDPGDAAVVAAARAQVAAQCGCAGATDHAAYVDCATTIARLGVAGNALPRRCRADVLRCARRSTCGRPGTTPCCRARGHGARLAARCTVERDAATCSARRGCVPPAGVTSCCDACGPSGCVTSTTTSTSSTSTTTTPAACGDPRAPGPPLCWGTCPPATPICAATPGGCACVAGTTPCGSASFPSCDGGCAADRACLPSLTLGCTCDFQGLACAISGFPVCNGLCPSSEDDCVGVSGPDGQGCICVPRNSSCHQSGPACGGTCPEGTTCQHLGAPFTCMCL